MWYQGQRREQGRGHSSANKMPRHWKSSALRPAQTHRTALCQHGSHGTGPCHRRNIHRTPDRGPTTTATAHPTPAYRNTQIGDDWEFSHSREVGKLWPHNKTNRQDRHSNRDGESADSGPTKGNWGRSSPTSPPSHPRTSAPPTRPTRMCMNRTTREPVTLSTCHLIPFCAVNITAESRQPWNPYWLERPRTGEDHTDVPTAVDFNSSGDKMDGKGGETSSSYTHASYNYGHFEVSLRPKDTSTYHTKRPPTKSTTASYHQPRRPCQRQVRTEVGKATTPAGVITANGPQRLAPRHAEARQAQTGRHSHHEVCYRTTAAAPWCL